MLPLDTRYTQHMQHIGSDSSLAIDPTEEEPQPDNPSRPFTLQEATLPASVSARLISRTRVQMKVQDGCDNRCTYCIVPYVRGGSRSRSIASVVEHVQRKVRAGFQEIVLTGIHLGDYHPDNDQKQDLGDLIAVLLRETGIPRIRVSSLEPEDFRLEWLELWKNPRMCRHFHLPMQSGSDAILRRMARRYNSARYRTIITTARQLIPGVAISTDIITGFPGESESDFEQTYQLAKELQFAKTHVFRFSPRQGTPAARMKGQIKDEVKKARSERLLALNEEHSRLFRQQFLGDTVQVLDTTEGGIHALFRLGVREPTRFLYDFHFFHDEDAPVVRALRAEFIRDLDARPPRMIVLFERGWPAGGYERVERFAALADRLRERYEVAATRPGYRLYAKRHDP